MARKVFYSFHYQPDNWRVSQVRNFGVIEGNRPAADNDWEQVKRGGDAAIQRWIDGQLNGRSCTVLLIGAQTAGRKWINYEIEKSWNSGKGLVGIHIYSLKNRNGETTTKGQNPFALFKLENRQVKRKTKNSDIFSALFSNETALSDVVKVYDPWGFTSNQVYDQIGSSLSDWVEEAITIRQRY
jgi:hypothetical protein